jgi:putative acetyltransferase
VSTPALRRATAADAAAIAALFSASRRLLTFLPELHSVDEDRAFIRDVVFTGCRVTLAERGGTLAGFIAERDGWIDHLYVDPPVLHSGVGSALIDDAKRRHPSLELWCFEGNLPARRFYEQRGFVVMETTDGRNNEARMPDLRYRWSR